MAGIGDVGIMNSYYIAKMISSSDAEEAKVGKEIGVLFPENTLKFKFWSSYKEC